MGPKLGAAAEGGVEAGAVSGGDRLGLGLGLRLGLGLGLGLWQWQCRGRCRCRGPGEVSVAVSVSGAGCPCAGVWRRATALLRATIAGVYPALSVPGLALVPGLDYSSQRADSSAVERWPYKPDVACSIHVPPTRILPES